jgi:hypothetical protein
MQKWEYLKLRVIHNSLFGGIDSVFLNGNNKLNKENYKDLNALYIYVNDLGLQGWELVSTSSEGNVERFYFKRPIE